MSRFVSQLSFAQNRRPAAKPAAADAVFADRMPRGYARLVRTALDLLQDGDMVGTREVLRAILATSKGRRTWADSWPGRVPFQRPQRVRDQHRADAERVRDEAAQPLAVETARLPIRIRALGGFEVLIDGVPFVSGIKPQRRPLDLLKALLIANGHSVGAAELADKLWPDSDGDTARNSLQVAVHRLRRLLGRDETVVVQDRKVHLQHALFSVDLWVFEREAGYLSGLYAGDPPFAERAADVLALYRGHLFAHEPEQPWMLLPRERLRRVWLGLVRRLGEFYEARTDWGRAGELYQRALELDPFAEEVYRGLMRCQQRAGESAEAIHTYRCCREQLVAGLGVAPSAETQRLYHALCSAA